MYHRHFPLGRQQETRIRFAALNNNGVSLSRYSDFCSVHAVNQGIDIPRSPKKYINSDRSHHNDLPLPAGREKLASLAARYRNASGDDVVPLLRRIVNANLQQGGRANVEAVIAIACRRPATCRHPPRSDRRAGSMAGIHHS